MLFGRGKPQGLLYFPFLDLDHFEALCRHRLMPEGADQDQGSSSCGHWFSLSQHAAVRDSSRSARVLTFKLSTVFSVLLAHEQKPGLVVGPGNFVHDEGEIFAL